MDLLMSLPDFGGESNNGGKKNKTAYFEVLSSVTSTQVTAMGDTAQITAVFSEDYVSVDVESTKDLSNVVLQFADGTYQKFDGLTDLTGTFEGDDGQNIVRVWVKSGTNDSGDCPGCGERFTNILGVTHDMDDDVREPATIVEGDSMFPWDRSTGVIGQHFGTKLEGIYDGTSNTYIVGEKYIDASQYASGHDPGDNKNLYIGFSNDTHRWTFSPPLRDKPGVSNQHIFGSAHPGTWNVAFADGSVHGIGYAIDPMIHRYLGNRADSQRIPQDQW